MCVCVCVYINVCKLLNYCMHIVDNIQISFVGFVCGKCSQTGNSNHGTALNLIECVTCPPWHIGIFITICKYCVTAMVNMHD